MSAADGGAREKKHTSTITKPISLYEFGGTEEAVRQIQSRFVKHFTSCSPVLDIGCGRGVFLELLRKAGIQALGIDSSEEAIAYSREKALEVEQSDALTFLSQTQQRFGGIFCSHVIEHMDFNLAMDLLNLCHRALRSGGILLLVTPNPEDLWIISEVFWLDPTHVRPYPRLLLESMLQANSFGVVEAKQFIGSWRIIGRRNLPAYFVRRILLGRHFGRPNLSIVAKAN